ncbi:hypothetical protein MUN81_03740 [Hymenobacter sp. 5317J-9]|uniref:hypothetical protein n=1 Tax=Hymenobacter sp. 5317J-9 TaxID=2932250 RepID=UPI001FD65366|nr:hypothetical protein [Hymenobacter sp. 5317J-9]UOQ98608.1 hypothetical protein MUN81_03740 [Hymenobacter sp. 5317J-9]
MGGGGDGSGLGQRPIALHYSLVCLDTAGRFRWQRQYPNPAIRLGPAAPAFVGGYAYLMQVLEAPRQRLLLLGYTQRDSVSFQLYAMEVDTAGQLLRTRWVEPFGRRASVTMTSLTNAVRLRDGSGYVLTGFAKIDSLTRTRSRGFVAKLDTALRVVWRTLLPTPSAAGPPVQGVDVQPGQVRERADGGFTVLVTEQGGLSRRRENEVDFIRLNAQGRVLGWDSYCTQTCNRVEPYSWQYLPADSSIIVSGWGEQRDAVGRVLARPAWLARLAGAPCRRYVVPAVPTAARAGAGVDAPGLYPQPARAGDVVRLTNGGPARPVRLLDALGREVARWPAPARAGGALVLPLPAGLRPGLYLVQALGGAPITARLLVSE